MTTQTLAIDHSRIYDVTNTATLIEMEHAGMRSYEPNGDATQFAMEGEDIVTFASETTIRLETIASVSVSGNGGYYYAASGIDAVQSRVVIQRLG